MVPNIHPPHSFPAIRIEVHGRERIKSPPRTVVKGKGERPFLQLSRGQMETVQQHREQPALVNHVKDIIYTCTPECKINSSVLVNTLEFWEAGPESKGRHSFHLGVFQRSL